MRKTLRAALALAWLGASAARAADVALITGGHPILSADRFVADPAAGTDVRQGVRDIPARRAYADVTAMPDSLGVGTGASFSRRLAPAAGAQP